MSELEVSTAETEEVLAVEKVEEKREDELLLLNCLQYLLRVNGIEKSVASIRETADMSSGKFNFEDAVSVLRNLDFSANVGTLKPRQVKEGHCPGIVVFRDGRILVLVKVD